MRESHAVAETPHDPATQFDRFASTFTAASLGSPSDSTAFLFKVSTFRSTFILLLLFQPEAVTSKRQQRQQLNDVYNFKVMCVLIECVFPPR